MASGPYDEVPESPVLSRLGAVLNELKPPRFVELVEDQTDKYADVLADLQEEYSTTGDGKRITSAHAYIGVESAITWIRCCEDRLYPVMRRSIETFASRWSQICPSLGAGPYHYVSLGTGDGLKDAVILRDLRHNNPGLCYVPVDTSTEMTKIAVGELLVQNVLPVGHILSMPLDFSVLDNIETLRRTLTKFFDDTPVLFSLLGNTVANFDDDAELLRTLTNHLLRPQDRLLLEVATTPSLDQRHAAEAAAEYRRSNTFGEFVTSALRRYTNLDARKKDVRYEGSVEGDHALLIKMNYQNQTGSDVLIKLPEGDPVHFRPDDTIRLLLTRKYPVESIDAMLANSGVSTVNRVHSNFAEGNRPEFGMDLMVLSTEEVRSTDDGGPSAAQDIWR